MTYETLGNEMDSKFWIFSLLELGFDAVAAEKQSMGDGGRAIAG